MGHDKRRILFVDDEQNNLQAFKANFRREFEVLTANSAEEGREIMRTNENIEVVISDQRMPSETGVEFLESVRISHPTAVRMLITGYSDMSAVVDAINKAKVASYMKKPFDHDSIVSEIEDALQNAVQHPPAHTESNNEYERAPLPDKQRQELNSLLDEYTDLWEAWINRSTLLSAKEVLAVEYFKKHGDHNVLANELGVSKNSVYNSYTKAVGKLRSNLNTLNSWIVARALELREKEDSGQGNSKFLQTPFRELAVSKPLVIALSTIDCHKPEHVIELTTLSDLMNLRNFGRKKLDELVKLFEDHGYDHLLEQ